MIESIIQPAINETMIPAIVQPIYPNGLIGKIFKSRIAYKNIIWSM